MSRLGSGPESKRPARHWVGRRSKAMKTCPVCNGQLYYPPVKGEFGTYDTTIFKCRVCDKEFPAKDFFKQKPVFIMPTCPESGKPVNQCRCDKCPIPF